MPLDPSISLQAGQGVRPIDPMGAFQQALTLRALSDQSQAQQLALQRQQRAMQRQEGIGRAYAVGPDGQIDNETTIRNLIGGNYGPEAAEFSQQVMQQRLQNEKAQREAQKAEWEGEKARTETVVKQAALVRDEIAALGLDAPYHRVIAKGMELKSMGVPFDPSQVPNNPQELRAWMEQKYMGSESVIKNYEARFGPKSQQGQLAQDYFRAPPDQRKVLAPAVSAMGGPATALTRFDENGNVVPSEVAIRSAERVGKASASQTKVDVNLPINAYEKKLSQNDADAVSKARANSEGLGAAAGEVRAIADALKGYSGGRWDEAKAKLGEYLPGTPWADMASVNQIAESIRQKAGPAQRVEGSGSTSDVEFKGMMASLPSLLMYEKGRELVARTFERRAQQAQISADIKDQLVRSGAYSAARHAEEMKKQFGDRLFTREDMDLMRQIKSGKGAESAAPKKSYKGLWRSQ